MRSVMLVFGGLFRFFGRLIFTPIMLGWLIGAMVFGAMLGSLVATPFIFAFFDQTPGESAWQWPVFGPFMFVGAVFGFQYWRMASGADAYFGLTGVLTVTLPRFLASNASMCAVLGASWTTTTTGVDACVFYQR